MLIKISLALIGIFFLHSILPAIYYKYFYRKDYGKKDLTFSFDDGPNPDFSPRLKELLDQNQIQAYFFQVGEKVKAYPNIVKDLAARGHKLGIHCYQHSHPIFWGPYKTYKDIRKARAVLEDLGLETKLYRPPHGWVNLTMVFFMKVWQLDLVLWNFLPGDWKEDQTWQETYQKLIKAKSQGGLVCLHDSNHKIKSNSKAPENTLRALAEFFSK
ncbi:MAG: polysaccharide deacetylase family protein [Bacillota bacterium]|nr:polysaccharide deacetylase family protein [Bacillota bacterium]